MKAAALHDRGTRRDFVDIHAICRRPDWSVARFIDLATTRLPLAPVQMKLALTYYADAEKDVVRFRYDVPWERVKADLQQGVLAWERNQRRGQQPEGMPVAEAKEAVMREMGRRVRLAREHAGLTQAALAAKLGVTQARVSRAESGTVSLSSAFIARVHKACKLPVDWVP